MRQQAVQNVVVQQENRSPRAVTKTTPKIIPLPFLDNETPASCNSTPLGAAWAYYIKVLVLASMAS